MQAQGTGAEVIALANSGLDAAAAMKQAVEFGLQTVAPLSAARSPPFMPTRPRRTVEALADIAALRSFARRRNSPCGTASGHPSSVPGHVVRCAMNASIFSTFFRWAG